MPKMPITRVRRAQKGKQERNFRLRSVSIVVAFLMMVAIILGGVTFSNMNYSSTAYDYTTRSPDGWSEDVRITVNQDAPDREPAIAASGENIHIVWTGMEYAGARQKIMYTKSNNHGETWSEFQQLSFDGMNSKRSSIAVVSDNIHVVWDDTGGIAAYEIRYTRSTDGGITWSEPMFISSNDGHNSQAPKIAVSEDGLDVHVVWVDRRHGSESSPPNTELYYNRSLDGGITWEGEVRITEAPYASAGPNIAVKGSNVHLVWSDERAGKFDIYYRRSLNSGATWQNEVVLADGSNWEVGPDVAVWDGNVHVVWVETNSEDIILHRNSTGSGDWSDAQVLTSSSIRAVRPRIVAIEDEVHMVWFDGRDGGNEIYYKNSISGVWGPDTRLTYTNNSESLTPTIAVDNEKIHVTWHDDRDGLWEVYYKRSPDFINVPEFGSIIVPVIVTIIIYFGIMYNRKKEKYKGGQEYENG